MLKKLTPILIILAMLLTSCQDGATATPAPGPTGYTPKFEKSDCPFDKGQGVTVDCGYLVVPEDRANPQGPTIRIAVARYKASLPNPASDPIVYLEGGPGGSALRSYPKNFTVIFGPFTKTHQISIPKLL